MAGTNGNDFQQNNIVYILNRKDQMSNPRGIWINKDNLIICSIYYAVRKCLNVTWLNDRDQFLIPNAEFNNREFENDCLIYTIFNVNIQYKDGINHWIPFTEEQVNAKEKFDSNFMSDFINGSKIKPTISNSLFDMDEDTSDSFIFSDEAKKVFDCGLALWKYFHTKPNINVNSSLYDIREYFQGRNSSGKMNNKSTDEYYMRLINELRSNIKLLAKKIEPKVYEYGFLKR